MSKKLLSMILAIIMVVSMFAGITVTTSAASTVKSGEYVIAAVVDGTYYAMFNTSLNGKISAKEITVTNGTVALNDATDYRVLVNALDNGNITIFNDAGLYLGHSSSTNFANIDAYEWVPTVLEDGTVRLVASTADNRSIIYRLSTNVFAPYAYSNVDGAEYFDIVLLPIVGASDETFGSFGLIEQSDVTAGKYIIATASDDYPAVKAATNVCKNDWNISETIATAQDDMLALADFGEEAQVFTFNGDNTNGFTISYTDAEGTVVYLGYTSYANRKLAFAADYSDFLWKVIADPDGGVALQNGSEGNYYTICRNGSNLRGYASESSYTGVYLFKEGYTPKACEHVNTKTVKAVKATCTTDGYSGDIVCVDCGRTVMEGTVIEATGHNFVGTTCTICGAAGAFGLVSATNATEGKYIIGAVKDGAYPAIYLATATCVNDWTVSETAVSAKNDKITELTDDAQIFTLSGDNTKGFTISYTDENGKAVYLGYSEYATRKLAFSAEYSSTRWVIIADPDGGLALQSGSEGSYYTISQNSTTATPIRGYASGKVYTGIYLFKEGQTPDACTHANTKIVNAVAATCTASGYSGDTVCTHCGETVAVGTTVAATGHTFVDGICSACGASDAFGLVNATNVTEGKYVIGAVKDGAYPAVYLATATCNNDWAVSDTVATAKDDKILEIASDAQIFTLSGDNTKGFTISYTDENGKALYLGYSEYATRKLAFGAEYSSTRWIVIEDPDGGVALQTGTEGSYYTVSQNSTTATPIRGYASNRVYDGIYLFKHGFKGGETEPTYEFNENLRIAMNISVGAEMQVKYTLPKARVQGFESFYVEVVKVDANGNKKTTKFSLEDGTLEEKYNNSVLVGYNATYTGIFASEMGDDFTAILYAVAADGTVNYGPEMTSSIKDYLLDTLALESTSAQLKTLAVDMLNYGSAAQIFFGYDVQNLVNSDLTKAQKAYGTQGTPKAVNASAVSGNGIKLTADVSLQSKVMLFLTCRYTSNANSNLKFVVKDIDGKIIDEFAPTKVLATACQGSYSNVGARQMRDLLVIELYDNDKLVSQSMTWSVESYVAATRENAGSSAELISAVNAMLIYGDSAAAYLAASGQ